MDEYQGRGAEPQLEFDDPEHRSGHSSSESSGTGKLLTMFFGGAVVCAIFFGLGYKMGKSSSSQESGTVRGASCGAEVSIDLSKIVLPGTRSKGRPRYGSREASATVSLDSNSIIAIWIADFSPG